LKTIVRFVFALGFAGAMAPSGWSQPEMPYWQPDEATLRTIESTLLLPPKDQWTPGPLETYARYYTGWTEKCHRIIAGNFEKGPGRTKDKPGIYIVRHAERPMATGGGCDHIVMRYDVDLHQVIYLQCYGLG
jgi:hypothetical protein